MTQEPETENFGNAMSMMIEEDKELIRSMVAEGFHTGFRKATDHDLAHPIWKMIQELPGEHYAAVVDFVVEPLFETLNDQIDKRRRNSTTPP